MGEARIILVGAIEEQLYRPKVLEKLRKVFPQVQGEDIFLTEANNNFDLHGKLDRKFRRQVNELAQKNPTVILLPKLHNRIADFIWVKSGLGVDVRQVPKDIQNLSQMLSWMQSLDVLQGTRDNLPDLQSEIQSVHHAIDEATNRFEGKIAFQLNNASVRKTPFQNPGEVFQFFEHLAHTYRQMRMGKVDVTDFDKFIKHKITAQWFYRANQSKTTMGRWSRYYECFWRGEKVDLPNHAGVGSSRNSRYCIRIAFFWDQSSEIVVVGYVGPHQQTESS